LLAPKLETLAAPFDAVEGVVSKIFLDSDRPDGLEQFDQLIWDRTDPSFTLEQPLAILTSSYICDVRRQRGRRADRPRLQAARQLRRRDRRAPGRPRRQGSGGADAPVVSERQTAGVGQVQSRR
jgi:hypothetical protein